MRIALFLLLTSAVACSSGEKLALPAASDAGAKAVGVRVVTPSDRLEGGLRRATGELRARDAAVLSSPATGTIERFLVDVGAKVKAGQELMRLDASNARIMVEQANAARAIAEAAELGARQDLERTRALQASGGVAQAGLDRMEAGYKQAAAGLAQATAAAKAAAENLRDQTLRAPFAGTITDRFKNTGETVTMMPATPVLALTDIDRLEVRLQVPEALVGALAPGAEIAGTTSPSGTKFTAKVRSVGMVVHPATRTIEVLADVLPPLDPALRPGSLVEAEIGDAELDGLFLPSRAVVRDAGELFVWVVADNAATRRKIEGSQVTPGIVRVVQGLTAQDAVIADGSVALTEGATVQVAQ